MQGQKDQIGSNIDALAVAIENCVEKNQCIDPTVKGLLKGQTNPLGYDSVMDLSLRAAAPLPKNEISPDQIKVMDTLTKANLTDEAACYFAEIVRLKNIRLPATVRCQYDEECLPEAKIQPAERRIFDDLIASNDTCNEQFYRERIELFLHTPPDKLLKARDDLIAKQKAIGI
jgi:hypothetical protein